MSGSTWGYSKAQEVCKHKSTHLLSIPKITNTMQPHLSCQRWVYPISQQLHSGMTAHGKTSLRQNQSESCTPVTTNSLSLRSSERGVNGMLTESFGQIQSPGHPSQFSKFILHSVSLYHVQVVRTQFEPFLKNIVRMSLVWLGYKFKLTTTSSWSICRSALYFNLKVNWKYQCQNFWFRSQKNKDIEQWHLKTVN